MAARRVWALWASFAVGEVIVLPAVLIGAIVAIASLVVGSKRGDVRVDIALANMAAFLFGVLIAFIIVRSRERLAQVQSLVASGDASLFSIHQAMAVFDADDRSSIRELIDRHLTDQIDYRLVDYHRATPSYLELSTAVHSLDPMTPQQEGVYKELIALCMKMQADRAMIEAATGQSLSPIEWVGLSLLLLLLLGLIAVLPGGTVWGALVAGVMAGTLVTLMTLLRKLDLLRWHERVTLWEPTTRLFRSMGRDPYVPREVIAQGRYRPTGRVRVVDYPDAYPVRHTKAVTLEEFGEIRNHLSAGTALPTVR